jgi:hypothetical protein
VFFSVKKKKMKTPAFLSKNRGHIAAGGIGGYFKAADLRQMCFHTVAVFSTAS